MLLKLVMGPVFAIVGTLVLQAKIVSGIEPATSLKMLVVWATIFGAAQQSVTRVIDRRVSGLLTDEPSEGERRSKRRQAPRPEPA